MSNNRRIGRVEISMQLMTQLLRKAAGAGLPDDFEVIGVEQRLSGLYAGVFELYFTSEKNPVMVEGCEPSWPEWAYEVFEKLHVAAAVKVDMDGKNTDEDGAAAARGDVNE